MLAALAVGLVAQLAVTRPVPDGVPAVVAVREVAAGTELTEDALALRVLPRTALPDGALLEPGAALGRPASSVLAAGEVLTRSDVRTAEMVAGLGPGTVAVWVPVLEPAVTASLGAGDRVDLRSPSDGSFLAREVLVLAVGSAEQGGAWVAVDDGQAAALAARGGDPLGGAVHVALRGP
ncbi:SAF domain-containing protein [Ornithinimicrobium sp. W1679]|uniref:SAF domain-containing protein n=1 Tax=Ornithinimicrobium sp. W1679 TaxID=3418770 RepID=UPI003CE68236